MPQSRIYNPFVGSGGGGGSDPNAEEIRTMSFGYNDASPKLVFPIPAGARIVFAQIQITTPFNDASATLTIGDSGDVSRLMSSSQNIPSESGEYESHTGYQYGSTTNVNLTINKGASTQGAGVVVIAYNLNN
ncbi:MAG: hypothetical protein H7836_04505 [Magnetococcus sp. YQC-3]